MQKRRQTYWEYVKQVKIRNSHLTWEEMQKLKEEMITSYVTTNEKIDFRETIRNIISAYAHVAVIPIR